MAASFFKCQRLDDIKSNRRTDWFQVILPHFLHFHTSQQSPVVTQVFLHLLKLHNEIWVDVAHKDSGSRHLLVVASKGILNQFHVTGVVHFFAILKGNAVLPSMQIFHRCCIRGFLPLHIGDLMPEEELHDSCKLCRPFAYDHLRIQLH